jgi:hypothetical protein
MPMNTCAKSWFDVPYMDTVLVFGDMDHGIGEHAERRELNETVSSHSDRKSVVCTYASIIR